MTKITIREMTVPSSIDAPDADEFCAMVTMGNAMEKADAGIDDLSTTAKEMLPQWLDQTDNSRRGFVARRDGMIVGAAGLVVGNENGATSAEIGLMVDPAEWGRGVEDALLDRVESAARTLERSSMMVWSLHPAAVSERVLTPATGWGRVAATGFSDLLTSRGWVLEQVERNSVLPLDAPMDLVEHKLAEAQAVAGGDYRLVSWALPTPEHLRDGYRTSSRGWRPTCLQVPYCTTRKPGMPHGSRVETTVSRQRSNWSPSPPSSTCRPVDWLPSMSSFSAQTAAV